MLKVSLTKPKCKVGWSHQICHIHIVWLTWRPDTARTALGSSHCVLEKLAGISQACTRVVPPNAAICAIGVKRHMIPMRLGLGNSFRML